jgi:hypothetical protein
VHRTVAAGEDVGGDHAAEEGGVEPTRQPQALDVGAELLVLLQALLDRRGRIGSSAQTLLGEALQVVDFRPAEDDDLLGVERLIEPDLGGLAALRLLLGLDRLRLLALA